LLAKLVLVWAKTMCKTPRILLVDDQDGDALLTMTALLAADFKCEIRHVKSGIEAIQILESNADGSGKRPFDIVLLDINMPQLNGVDVVRRIRVSDKIFNVAIFMLTTSADRRDIDKCYECGADMYINKIHDFDGFVLELSAVHEYIKAVVRHGGHITHDCLARLHCGGEQL